MCSIHRGLRRRSCTDSDTRKHGKPNAQHAARASCERLQLRLVPERRVVRVRLIARRVVPAEAPGPPAPLRERQLRSTPIECACLGRTISQSHPHPRSISVRSASTPAQGCARLRRVRTAVDTPGSSILARQTQRGRAESGTAREPALRQRARGRAPSLHIGRLPARPPLARPTASAPAGSRGVRLLSASSARRPRGRVRTHGGRAHLLRRAPAELLARAREASFVDVPLDASAQTRVPAS